MASPSSSSSFSSIATSHLVGAAATAAAAVSIPARWGHSKLNVFETQLTVVDFGERLLIGAQVASLLKRETFNMYRSMKIKRIDIRRANPGEVAFLVKAEAVRVGTHSVTLIPLNEGLYFIADATVRHRTCPNCVCCSARTKFKTRSFLNSRPKIHRRKPLPWNVSRALRREDLERIEFESTAPRISASSSSPSLSTIPLSSSANIANPLSMSTSSIGFSDVPLSPVASFVSPSVASPIAVSAAFVSSMNVDERIAASPSAAAAAAAAAAATAESHYLASPSRNISAESTHLLDALTSLATPEHDDESSFAVCDDDDVDLAPPPMSPMEGADSPNSFSSDGASSGYSSDSLSISESTDAVSSFTNCPLSFPFTHPTAAGQRLVFETY